VLLEGEEVLALTSGIMDGNTWLLTVTDRRILLLDKGMIFGLKQLDMPLSQIKSVSHKKGLLFGEILIDTGGQIKTVKNISKNDAPKVCAIIAQTLHSSAGPAKAQSGGTDVVAQLEKLAALKEKGLLTDEEFAAQKAKLLD
jgi:lambda repressor-like predicted transcriptional regulator